jgi:hypothetical protein
MGGREGERKEEGGKNPFGLHKKLIDNLPSQ